MSCGIEASLHKNSKKRRNLITIVVRGMVHGKFDVITWLSVSLVGGTQLLFYVYCTFWFILLDPSHQNVSQYLPLKYYNILPNYTKIFHIWFSKLFSNSVIRHLLWHSFMNFRILYRRCVLTCSFSKLNSSQTPKRILKAKIIRFSTHLSSQVFSSLK